MAEGLRLAAQTKQRFVERATRLYEQGAAASRIGEYVRHWLTWVRSGGLELVWDAFLDGVTRVSGSGHGARLFAMPPSRFLAPFPAHIFVVGCRECGGVTELLD